MRINDELDTYVLASEHGDKDAHWNLLQHFIDAVECEYPIEPEALVYLKNCLVRLIDGEDARKVFPSCNDVGHPKADGLRIARDIVVMLRDGKAKSLTEAFKMVGARLKKSPEIIKDHYKENKKLAEAMEHFSYIPTRGRPKNNR
jgi:hypothetical protein